jgi:hypothetical protein
MVFFFATLTLSFAALVCRLLSAGFSLLVQPENNMMRPEIIMDTFLIFLRIQNELKLFTNKLNRTFILREVNANIEQPARRLAASY